MMTNGEKEMAEEQNLGIFKRDRYVSRHFLCEAKRRGYFGEQEVSPEMEHCRPGLW